MRSELLQLASVSEQISYLTQLVASQVDWRLSYIYIYIYLFIYIESGSHAYNRKHFNRIVNDYRQGKLDIVVASTVSRFGRNTIVILDQLRMLTQCDVEVRCVQNELITADPDHELLIFIVVGLAQADNESHRENILWGIHR